MLKLGRPLASAWSHAPSNWFAAEAAPGRELGCPSVQASAVGDVVALIGSSTSVFASTTIWNAQSGPKQPDGIAAATSTELPAAITGVATVTGAPVENVTFVCEAAAGATPWFFTVTMSLSRSLRQKPSFPALGCGLTGTRSGWPAARAAGCGARSMNNVATWLLAPAAV